MKNGKLVSGQSTAKLIYIFHCKYLSCVAGLKVYTASAQRCQVQETRSSRSEYNPANGD